MIFTCLDLRTKRDTLVGYSRWYHVQYSILRWYCWFNLFIDVLICHAVAALVLFFRLPGALVDLLLAIQFPM